MAVMFIKKVKNSFFAVIIIETTAFQNR